MEKLPVELIEKILSYKSLVLKDIVNFSLTCHFFYNMVNNSNKIWKAHFYNNWPELAEKYVFPQGFNFLAEIKYGIIIKKTMYEFLTAIYRHTYERDKYLLPQGICSRDICNAQLNYIRLGYYHFLPHDKLASTSDYEWHLGQDALHKSIDLVLAEDEQYYERPDGNYSTH